MAVQSEKKWRSNMYVWPGYGNVRNIAQTRKTGSDSYLSTKNRTFAIKLSLFVP